MTPIELAVEKQRLLLESTRHRAALADHLAGLQPLFSTADQLRDGARWLGRHPEVVAGGVALLVALRPGTRRFLWRWGQRGFIAWRLWRNLAENIQHRVQQAHASDFWPQAVRNYLPLLAGLTAPARKP